MVVLGATELVVAADLVVVLGETQLVVVLGTAELAVVFGAAELVVVLGAVKPVVVHGIADFVVVVGAAVLKGFRMARHVLELKAAMVRRAAYLLAAYVCLSDEASKYIPCFVSDLRLACISPFRFID